MLDSQTTVAAVRLLGGAEIIIKRMESLRPDSQRPKAGSLFKPQHRRLAGAASGEEKDSLALNSEREKSAAVSSIGDGGTSGISPPDAPFYATGLQVEFRPAWNALQERREKAPLNAENAGAVDDNAAKPDTLKALSKQATEGRRLEKSARKQRPARPAAFEGSLRGEVRYGKSASALEPEPLVLDVRA